MTVPGPALRVLRVLALLVHLLVPGLVGVADARHSFSPEGGAAHVESQTHDCDSPVHGESCALLHFLRSPAIAQPALEIALPLPVAHRDNAVSQRFQPQRHLPLPLARGPPLHS